MAQLTERAPNLEEDESPVVMVPEIGPVRLQGFSSDRLGEVMIRLLQAETGEGSQ
ncbi:MAG TPA: hypothetical protein VLE51_02355 [Candidatus Saccharimonadales bacterium]|nr:hypothetical protein [Candidatus Saccharimonadales bacterium]